MSMDRLYVIYFCFIFSVCLAQSEPPCPISSSVNISDATEIQKRVFKKDNVTYDETNYFYDKGTRWGCICNIKKCIRMCCDVHHAYYEKECIPYSANYTFQVFKKTTPFPEINFKDYFLISGLKCPKNFTGFMVTQYFYIQEDGSVYFEDDFSESYPLERYCVNYYNNSYSAKLCDPNRDSSDDETQQEINGIGLIISMPFFFVTFLVYFILPERNVHRIALMNYVLSALLGSISLIIVQYRPDGFTTFTCYLLGYLIIFFYQVSFCWLNVMCVDMSLAFSSSTGFLSKATSEWKKVIVYNLYAWGVPFLFVFLVVMLNTYGNKNNFRHPELGEEYGCFLRAGWSIFYYFYLPMSILIGMNIIAFIITSLKILKIKKETKVLKRTDSKIHSYEDNKQKFNLYLKLMFAMGVNWSMEIISWAVKWNFPTAPNAIFYVTDAANALYGLVIFLIFVFKKRIWKSLRKRYYTFIGKPHLAITTSSRGTRTSGFSSENSVATTVESVYSSPTTKVPEEIPLYKHRPSF